MYSSSEEENQPSYYYYFFFRDKKSDIILLILFCFSSFKAEMDLSFFFFGSMAEMNLFLFFSDFEYEMDLVFFFFGSKLESESESDMVLSFLSFGFTELELKVPIEMILWVETIVFSYKDLCKK